MSPGKRRPTREILRDIAAQYGAAGQRLARAARRALARYDLVWDVWEEIRNAQRMIRYLREGSRLPAGTVVFLGSSSVVRFPLEQIFPGGLAVGRGLGAETLADTTRHVRWTIPAARPSGVVVWVGANDLRSLAADPLVVVQRVGRLLDAIHARFPAVPIAIIGLPPLCDQTDKDLDRLRRLNEGLAALAFARGLSFVDLCRPPLTTEDGRLSPAMADADRNHLGRPGYEQAARWIVESGGAAVAVLTLAPEVLERTLPSAGAPPAEPGSP